MWIGYVLFVSVHISHVQLFIRTKLLVCLPFSRGIPVNLDEVNSGCWKTDWQEWLFFLTLIHEDGRLKKKTSKTQIQKNHQVHFTFDSWYGNGGLTTCSVTVKIVHLIVIQVSNMHTCQKLKSF